MSPNHPKKPNQGRPSGQSRFKTDAQGRWTLVPPHCVFDLEPDLADIEMLIREGDFEAARDAALYILEECQDMTGAHLLLGKIAEKQGNDLTVAKAHYGYVFEITLKWLGDKAYGPMNGGQKINRVSLESAEGLRRVLEKRGEKQKASQVGSYIEAWKGHGPAQAMSGDMRQGGDLSGQSRRPLPDGGKRRPMMSRPVRRPKPGDQSSKPSDSE